MREECHEALYFQGSRLSVNFITSAAGSIQVEVLDSNRQAIPGFQLVDCQTIVGNNTDQVVHWNDASLKSLAGHTIRLRFILKDATSLRFNLLISVKTTNLFQINYFPSCSANSYQSLPLNIQGKSLAREGDPDHTFKS